MDALIDLVVSKIEGAGGSLSYSAIYDSLDDRQKRQLRNALKEGKARKKFHTDISLKDGEIQHLYRIGERPAQ